MYETQCQNVLRLSLSVLGVGLGTSLPQKNENSTAKPLTKPQNDPVRNLSLLFSRGDSLPTACSAFLPRRLFAGFLVITFYFHFHFSLVVAMTPLISISITRLTGLQRAPATSFYVPL